MLGRRPDERSLLMALRITTERNGQGKAPREEGRRGCGCPHITDHDAARGASELVIQVGDALVYHLRGAAVLPNTVRSSRVALRRMTNGNR